MPTLGQAASKMGLVLAASFVMLVLLNTLDSMFLFLYMLRARL